MFFFRRANECGFTSDGKAAYATYWSNGLEWALSEGYGGTSLLPEEVSMILLEIEGYNECEDWHWILQLKSGYAYVTGNCAFSGWDCGGWLDVHKASSILEAISLAPLEANRTFMLMLEKHITHISSDEKNSL